MNQMVFAQKVSITFQEFVITPPSGEPAWSSLVERWYQLDNAAFLLAEVGWQLREQIESRPDMIILASSLGSNQTDFDFVKSGCSSAAKFVHTLPSVRGTSLFQSLEWNGPVLCLQDGQNTILSALSEALDECSFRLQETWIFSVLNHQTVLFFRVVKGASRGISSSRKTLSADRISRFDSDLLDWIRQSNSESFIWHDGLWERTLNAPSV